MTRLWTGLILLIGLAGCDDVVGLGDDCRSEMMLVRLREGDPPGGTSGPHRSGRDQVEYWDYGNRVIIFRWGPTLDGCRVQEERLPASLRALTLRERSSRIAPVPHPSTPHSEPNPR